MPATPPLFLKAAALAVAFVASTLVSAGAASAQDNETPNITVTAEGTARAVPDMAVTSFTVLREAPDTVSAMDAANQAMSDVIEAMKEFGIADRDIQTAGFNIRPIYDNRQRREDENGETDAPRIVGYAVSNSLTVRIRDLSKTGEILAQAVELGVNADGNLSLTSSDPESILEEARRDAVKQAMAKAETLADAAGVSLGQIISLSEGGYSRPPMPVARMEMKMADSATSVPVEAGENEYTVSVSLKVGISGQPARQE